MRALERLPDRGPRRIEDRAHECGPQLGVRGAVRPQRPDHVRRQAPEGADEQLQALVEVAQRAARVGRSDRAEPLPSASSISRWRLPSGGRSPAWSSAPARDLLEREAAVAGLAEHGDRGLAAPRRRSAGRGAGPQALSWAALWRAPSPSSNVRPQLLCSGSERNTWTNGHKEVRSKWLSIPAPEHDRLGVLIGKWKTEGWTREMPDAPASRIDAIDTYEWLPGGFGLLHDRRREGWRREGRWGRDHRLRPRTRWIHHALRRQRRADELRGQPHRGERRPRLEDAQRYDPVHGPFTAKTARSSQGAGSSCRTAVTGNPGWTSP